MKIELQNISFGYNEKEKVLDNISFSIPSSSCLAIVGSSGSGKSTILKLINGLLLETHNKYLYGNLFVNDINITKEKEKWKNFRSLGKLGFMFQDSNLLPHLDVESNINLPLKITGKTNEQNNTVLNYLNFTGLLEDKHKLPRELSGGMKTRVALARTFITKPQILLLDEPFSSLDIVWKSILYDEVKRMKKEYKTTVVLVTHDIFEAINFSNNIIILGDNHKIIDNVKIKDWNEDLNYNDVVLKYNKDFIKIKQLIEQSRLTRK